MNSFTWLEQPKNPEVMNDPPNCLLSLGKYFGFQKDSSLILYVVEDGQIKMASHQLAFDGIIEMVYDSSNPETFEPGIILCSSSNITYFLSHFSDPPELLELPNQLSETSSKVAYFNNFKSLVINNNKLLAYYSHDQPPTEIMEQIPEDSYFLCCNNTEAIVASQTTSWLCLVSDHDKQDLPSGFLYSIQISTFFDDESIVFVTTDSKLVKFSFDGYFDSIQIDFKVIKIQVADIDSYERSCICLSSEKDLYIVHFSSKAITKLCNSVEDFCIIQNPFDTILTLNRDDKISIIGRQKSTDLNKSLLNVIDALDSRIENGLVESNDLRQRISFRHKFTKNNANLPFMLNIFGIPPEKDCQKVDESYSCWLENVMMSNNDISFEIHSNMEIPSGSEGIISSNGYSLICRSSTVIHSKNVISVSSRIIIENAFSFEPVFIYLITEDSIIYVDTIELSPDVLTNVFLLDRIDASYYVSFPYSFVEKFTIPFEHEQSDKGMIIHIKADNYETFKHNVCIANAIFPEGTIYKRIKNPKILSVYSKALIDFTQSFVYQFILSQSKAIEKSDLNAIKCKIDDYLSLLTW